jgi:hypothetical protein
MEYKFTENKMDLASSMFEDKFKRTREYQEWFIRYFMLTLELDFRVIDAFVSTGVLSHPVGIYNEYTYDKDSELLKRNGDMYNPHISYRVYLPNTVHHFQCYARSITGTEYRVPVRRIGKNGAYRNWDLNEYILKLKKLPENTKFTLIYMHANDVRSSYEILRDPRDV